MEQYRKKQSPAAKAEIDIVCLLLVELHAAGPASETRVGLTL